VEFTSLATDIKNIDANVLDIPTTEIAKTVKHEKYVVQLVKRVFAV